MRTEIPIECNASAATNRLSWSWTMNRSTTKVSMPRTTAIKAFTFGGCRRTHTDTMWIGFLAGLMRWNDCYPFFFCKVAGLTGGGGGLIFRGSWDSTASFRRREKEVNRWRWNLVLPTLLNFEKNIGSGAELSVRVNVSGSVKSLFFFYFF